MAAINHQQRCAGRSQTGAAYQGAKSALAKFIIIIIAARRGGKRREANGKRRAEEKANEV